MSSIPCPTCQRPVEMLNPSATLAECKACGEVFVPFVAPDKTCVVCGKDASHGPRTRDQDGNYYCRSCWDVRPRQMGEVVLTYSCAVCQNAFDAESLAKREGAVVCVVCDAHTRPAAKPESYACAGCRTTLSKDNVYEHEGKHYCFECVCAFAQNPGRGGTGPLKPECACNVCRKLFTTNDVYNIDGTFICTNCWTKRQHVASRSAPEAGSVSCPYCAGSVRSSASRCRHCGKWLDGRPDPAPAARRGRDATIRIDWPRWFVMAVFIGVITAGFHFLQTGQIPFFPKSQEAHARACLEKELGTWMIGRESRARPGVKGPDGRILKEVVLLNYDIKFVRSSPVDPKHFEAGVSADIRWGESGSMAISIVYRIMADPKEADGWSYTGVPK